MKLFFKIIIIFLYASIALAKDKAEGITSKIHGSKDMPLELNLFIDSLQSSVGHKIILPLVMNIDSYARFINKEDIFIVVKIEIYKSLLKSNNLTSKAIIDGASVAKLKDSLLKVDKPILKWFINALLADVETLLKNPNYKDYLVQKNNGKIERDDFKKIDKKVQLLYQWVSKIDPRSLNFQESLESNLVPVMITSLINIERNFSLITINTSFKPFPGLITSPDQLKIFTFKKNELKKKSIITEKSVEDILAPITDETRPMTEPVSKTLPKPQKDDWLQEDNSPPTLKNLPKPSDDADWLQDI